jgi:hypothetical protein
VQRLGIENDCDGHVGHTLREVQRGAERARLVDPAGVPRFVEVLIEMFGPRLIDADKV